MLQANKKEAHIQMSGRWLDSPPLEIPQHMVNVAASHRQIQYMPCCGVPGVDVRTRTSTRLSSVNTKHEATLNETVLIGL